MTLDLALLGYFVFSVPSVVDLSMFIEQVSRTI